MRGSMKEWEKQLKNIGFDDLAFNDLNSELVLVRNSIIHNNGRVSVQLATKFPSEYVCWKRIVISDQKLEDFFNSTHKTATWLQVEYSRMYPNYYTTWDKPNYGLPTSN